MEYVSRIPKNGEKHFVIEHGAAMKTHLQGCSELLGFWF
jgi:hypothetical protein